MQENLFVLNYHVALILKLKLLKYYSGEWIIIIWFKFHGNFVINYEIWESAALHFPALIFNLSQNLGIVFQNFVSCVTKKCDFVWYWFHNQSENKSASIGFINCGRDDFTWLGSILKKDGLFSQKAKKRHICSRRLSIWLYILPNKRTGPSPCMIQQYWLSFVTCFSHVVSFIYMYEFIEIRINNLSGDVSKAPSSYTFKFHVHD